MLIFIYFTLHIFYDILIDFSCFIAPGQDNSTSSRPFRVIENQPRLKRTLWSFLGILPHSQDQTPNQFQNIQSYPRTQNYASPPSIQDYYLPLYEHALDYQPVKTRFDDAPELVYGIAFRVRRIYECGEKGLDCDQLEAEGKIVDCETPRFRYSNFPFLHYFFRH